MSVEKPNSSQEVLLTDHFWVAPILSLHVKIMRVVPGHSYESDFLFPCQWNSLKQGNDLLNIIAICIHTFFSVRRFCYHRRVTVLTARWWTCKYICVSSLILLTACRGCLNFFLFKSSLVWLWNITIYLNLRLRKGKLVDQWWPRKRWFSNSS